MTLLAKNKAERGTSLGGVSIRFACSTSFTSPTSQACWHKHCCCLSKSQRTPLLPPCECKYCIDFEAPLPPRMKLAGVKTAPCDQFRTQAQARRSNNTPGASKTSSCKIPSLTDLNLLRSSWTCSPPPPSRSQRAERQSDAPSIYILSCVCCKAISSLRSALPLSAVLCGREDGTSRSEAQESVPAGLACCRGSHHQSGGWAQSSDSRCDLERIPVSAPLSVDPSAIK